ncbi:MAG: YfhO family protein [Coriobacteriia bacterium]|nr:YfhO family protein [Coriobacteriia bacterium]
MNWSDFYYLAVVALACVGLCVFMVRKAACLTSATRTHTALELGSLCAILLLGCAAVYGCFLWGSHYFAYTDVGADSIDQYVPFYLSLIDSVREGTFSMWNFDFGLGTSALGYQSWLFDPFNLLLVPAGLLLGDGALSGILAFLQVLKVLLCGVLFDRLLLRFCETPLARILGAGVYALCGYLCLWGQHYWLGSVLVVFTALLWAAELLMERWSVPRFVFVAAMCALAAGWSPYCGFMMLLGTAIYALLRIISQAKGTGGQQAANVLRDVGRLAAPVLCGCLVACVALLPYAQFLFGETGRVGGTQVSTASKALGFAASFVPLRWIPMIASRLLGISLITSGEAIPNDLVPATQMFQYVNCYELLALGLSVAALVLLAQFLHWAYTELGRKDKILVTIGMVLVLLYCFNFFFPALFNAFVEPKYRSAFVVIAPLCIACAIGWEKRIQAGNVNLPAFAVGGAITLAVLVWALVNSVNDRLLCAFELACFVAIVALMLVAWRSGAKGSASLGAVVVVLCAVVLASSVADDFFTTNKRVSCTQDNFPAATQPNVSTETQETLTALAEADPEFYRVEKTYTDWTWLNDSLAEGFHGVKAYNSTTDSDIVEFFSAAAPDMMAYGTAYQLYFNDPDVPVVNNLLGVRYLLSDQPVEMESFQPYTQINGVYVYRNENASMLTSRTSCLSESAFAALPTTEEKRAALEEYLVVPDDVAASSANAATVTSQTAGSGDVLTQATVNLGSTDDTVTATVEATRNAVAMLSIPHTAGWTVKLDGQPIETFRADLGFIGFELPAGTHTLEAHYEVPGTQTGLILTAVGLLLTVAACLLGTRLNTRTPTGRHTKK